ncbi:MAG: hypothetical protein PHI85_04210 [Victivallaceae bacterium]|nr:hypothetical protein [Victivallaceae bacterium]
MYLSGGASDVDCPLLYPGIPNGHDIHFHLARICGIADGLRNGQFPVYVSRAALRIGPSKTGLAEVVIPSGTPDGTVSVFYAGIRIQKVSGLVSLATVLLLAAMALFGGGGRGLRAAKRRACCL